jgi:hypothetical protein
MNESESSPADHSLAPIADALFRGNKIEAIKLYRERHGGGLKEAKDAVEELEARLRETSPERFAAAPRAGCLGWRCWESRSWFLVGSRWEWFMLFAEPLPIPRPQ